MSYFSHSFNFKQSISLLFYHLKSLIFLRGFSALVFFSNNSFSFSRAISIIPFWKIDTTILINDFISRQFKTVIFCTNDGYLGEEWVGKEIDKSFINQLPIIVDPCGENGEYHTFCYDGPLFKNKIDFTIGEKVYKAIEIKTGDDCTV